MRGNRADKAGRNGLSRTSSSSSWAAPTNQGMRKPAGSRKAERKDPSRHAPGRSSSPAVPAVPRSRRTSAGPIREPASHGKSRYVRPRRSALQPAPAAGVAGRLHGSPLSIPTSASPREYVGLFFLAVNLHISYRSSQDYFRSQFPFSAKKAEICLERLLTNPY